MQDIRAQASLIDTMVHRSITLTDNRTYDDQVSETITRIANISMGIAWRNNMTVGQARHYTSYVLSAIMIFLDLPMQHQYSLTRYMVDSVTGIYYFANGELRLRPTIYAESVFKGSSQNT
jgi:hypothetical protein